MLSHNPPFTLQGGSEETNLESNFCGATIKGIMLLVLEGFLLTKTHQMVLDALGF